jgi:DNA-binding CsgD family transcriptional regulator/tetratricopeptide (TPR) repeat protein
MNAVATACDSPNVLGILERDGQLATLQERFDQAARGSGHLVFLGAEAGAGKSSLVQEFLDLVGARARTLTGWCDPLTAPRPAGPLVDMAHGLGPAVASILRDEGRPGLFDAMYAELSTTEQPTVLVFEDVHWADETTLDLLRFLGRRVGRTKALVIATYRHDETQGNHPLRLRLGDLATQGAVSRMDLPPLTLAAVTTLAAGSGLDPVTLRARTGGNPFFVTELLQAATDNVPATVADAVVARTGRLSAAARHVLAAAAVIGPRAESSILRDLPGVDPAAVDECVGAGLLRLAAPVFTFRHELVRQAVLSVTSDLDLQQLSAQVLTALRSRAADPDELARLADLAEHAGDRAAVIEFAPAAAHRAASLGSHREAVCQYARALPYITGAEERADLLEQLSIEQYLTGDLGRAIASREEALEIFRARGLMLRLGNALRWLARLHWYAGNRIDGERCAAEALTVLTPLGPTAELAMAMSLESQLFMLNGDHESSIEWGNLALGLATELALPEVIAHATNNVGSSQAALGQVEGMDRLHESLVRSHAIKAEDHVARAYVNLAHQLVTSRQLVEAASLLQEAIAYTMSRDLDLQTPCLRATRALLNVHRGRWDDATAEANAVLRLPWVTPVHRFMALQPLAMMQVRTGAPYQETLDELGRLARELTEIQRLAPYAMVVAEAVWLTGQGGPADGEIERIYARSLVSGNRFDTSELTTWLHRLGHPVQGPAVGVGPFAQVLTDPVAAAAELHQLENPYDAAVALMDTGEPGLRRALEIFNGLGAKPAAAIASARLRGLGAANIPRGPRRRTRDHAHGLTSRQDEVLSLMAERLTNAEIAQRLFLSARTVDHHVSAILAKLDVASRDEATRKLGHRVRVT